MLLDTPFVTLFCKNAHRHALCTCHIKPVCVQVSYHRSPWGLQAAEEQGYGGRGHGVYGKATGRSSRPCRLLRTPLAHVPPTPILTASCPQGQLLSPLITPCPSLTRLCQRALRSRPSPAGAFSVTVWSFQSSIRFVSLGRECFSLRSCKRSCKRT